MIISFVFPPPQITQHISPYEQQVIMPWLKTFPKKAQQRFTTYLYPFSAIAISYAVVAWSEAADHAEDYQHRF